MALNKYIKTVEQVNVCSKKLSNGETMEYINIPAPRQLNIIPPHLNKIKSLNFVGSKGANIKVKYLEDGLMAAKLAFQKYNSSPFEIFEHDHSDLFESLEVANDDGFAMIDLKEDDDYDEVDWSDLEDLDDEEDDEDFEPTVYSLVQQEVSNIIYKNGYIVSLPIIQLSKFVQVVLEPHHLNNHWQLNTLKPISYWIDKSFPLIVIDDNPFYNEEELLNVLKNLNRFIILISVDPEKKTFHSVPTEFDLVLSFSYGYEYWNTELPNLHYYETALLESVHSAKYKLSSHINKSDLINLFKEYRGVRFAGIEDIYKWVNRAILKKTDGSNVLNYIDFERILRIY